MTSDEILGPPPWRVAAALGVIVALTVALALVSRRPDASGAAQAVSSAAGQRLPASVPSAPGHAPPQAAAVLADLDAALAAWGEFAVSGDLAALEPHFAPAGPQLAQLATEAPAIAADPPGSPPYLFDVVDYGGADLAGDIATVVSVIQLSRPGEPASSLRWRIELRWSPQMSRWQLWTATSLDR